MVTIIIEIRPTTKATNTKAPTSRHIPVGRWPVERLPVGNVADRLPPGRLLLTGMLLAPGMLFGRESCGSLPSILN